MRTQNQIRLFGLFCAICWASSPAFGDVVERLYEVEVAVASQSAADRQHAVRIALQQMLTRVTGLRNVPMNEQVLAALRNPDRYYAEYRFVEVDDAGETGEGDEAMRLMVRFVADTVQALVARAELPIWSANRPKVIAWLIVDEADGRRVLGADDDHPLVEGLRQQATARGVPLAVPLMDLEDQIKVPPSAIWGSLADALYQASSRYGADVLLIGRGREQAVGGWLTDWEFWLNDGEREYSFESETADAGAQMALDAVADEMMQRYAVLGRSTRPVAILVHGVAAVRDYAALMRYLAALEFIEKVEVVEVSADRFELTAHTRSSAAQLGQLLSMDGVLIPSFSRAPDARAGNSAPGWLDTPRLVLDWQGAGD